MTTDPDDADLYPAYRSGERLAVPLFFYHVPKAAGTTVNAALYALARFRGRVCRFVPRAIGMREANPPPGLFADDRVLVFSGHCWFGMHRQVAQPTNCAIVLREPIARAASEYIWRSRNRDLEPTAAGFEHYVRNVGLTNIATRLISGQSDIDWASLERAVANLRSCQFIGLTEHLDEFISAILTAYGGPNVKTRKAKEGREPLKSVLIERYAAMIADHNRYDLALYAEAQRLRAERMRHLTDAPRAPETMVVANPRGKRFDLV